jgi:hypothetical protein
MINQTSKYFLRSQPFNYDIIDGGRFIADKYGVRSYPTHVIIDTEGKVYFHTTGLSTNTVYWLNKTIEELLLKARKKQQRISLDNYFESKSTMIFSVCGCD